MILFSLQIHQNLLSKLLHTSPPLVSLKLDSIHLFFAPASYSQLPFLGFLGLMQEFAGSYQLRQNAQQRLAFTLAIGIFFLPSLICFFHYTPPILSFGKLSAYRKQKNSARISADGITRLCIFHICCTKSHHLRYGHSYNPRFCAAGKDIPDRIHLCKESNVRKNNNPPQQGSQ